MRQVCAALGVTLRAEYLPSALNCWADRLSRTPGSTDWSLSQRGFERLERRFGPHTLDLFATAENTNCGRFYSLLPSPGAAAVDAMQQPWTDDNCWCNPPFNLLGPVVHKIVRSHAQVTLVAPRWEAQPWWARAREACSAFVVLPADEGVFMHGSQVSLAPKPKWEVVAFRFGSAPVATPSRALSAGARCRRS